VTAVRPIATRAATKKWAGNVALASLLAMLPLVSLKPGFLSLAANSSFGQIGPFLFGLQMPCGPFGPLLLGFGYCYGVAVLPHAVRDCHIDISIL